MKLPWRLITRIFGILLLLLAFLLLVVFPLVSSQLAVDGLLPDAIVPWLRWVGRLQSLSMQIFVAGWFLFLGACFASFLNVVAWRVPRGRGINGSSHCPHCDVRLGIRDNIPIVGWIRNRGRCRTCQTPITPRYLIVELVLGVLTLVLVSLEIFGSGINLPGYEGGHFSLLDHVILEPQPNALLIFAAHMILIYTLFTITVIRSERFFVPASVVWVAGALAAIPLLMAPSGVPLLWTAHLGWGLEDLVHDWPVPLQTATTMLSGAVVGAIVGAVLDRVYGWAGAGFCQSALEPTQRPVAPPDPDAQVTVVPSALDEDWHRPLAGETDPLKRAEEPGAGTPAFGTTDGPSADPMSSGPQTEAPSAAEDPPQLGGGAEEVRVRQAPECVSCFGMIGLVLGWQAVMSVLVILLLVVGPIRWWAGSRHRWLGPLAGQIGLATLLLILGWRWFDQLVWPF